MKRCKEITAIEAGQLKNDLPDFRVGDMINVHMRITEGEKERIQLFSGTVIGRDGTGLSATMTLYRVSYGSGVERVFMIHSPKIAKIEIMKRGRVRKSKLTYLRGATGRKAKIEERIGALTKNGGVSVPSQDQEQFSSSNV